MNSKKVTILVSGGSRGLGLAIVAHYLAAGHRVATFARTKTKEIGALQEKHGSDLLFDEVDGSDAAGLNTFVSAAADRFERLSALINNAAVGQDHLLAHMPEEMIPAIVSTNLTGPMVLTRAVIRRMLLQDDGGRIVNITSICGVRGYAGLTVYSATKGGLDAFTRSLARELGGRNILVNSLAPGFFESQMSSVLASNQLSTIKRRTPTERLCTDQDLLPMLDLLVLKNTNITGQTMYVDGGATI